MGVGGQGHHPPLYRPDLLSYVLKYLRCEPVSVFKCSAGFLRINSRFCSVLQQKLFIYFLGPFYYISNKTTRPQFKDIMSENEFSKKKWYGKELEENTHWWLLEEALWILTTLYFIFIHDALYFFRVFSGNSIVQWQNFIISSFPPVINGRNQVWFIQTTAEST